VTDPSPDRHQPGKRRSRRISAGHVFAGIVTYFGINLFGGVVIFSAANGGGHRPVIASAAIVLALIAFGGGGALLAVGGPAAKGMGLGLMIGWAVTSIVTVGYCTGLNPVMYERGS
jgi:fatty acid desaturase